MKFLCDTRKKRGSVLIFALWILSLLVFFAVHIGLRSRQRIMFLSRLETRSRLHYVAEAGIKKAGAILKEELKQNGSKCSPYGKFFIYNNEEMFKGIGVGNGTCDVFYPYYEGIQFKPEIRYGVIDEESKININFSDSETLRRLIQNVVMLKEEEALRLAEAVLGWRELGKMELTGFYSDDFYANLQYPYEPKKAEFEIIDELLLVQGFTYEIVEKLKPFITIYGDGRVNINTAQRRVLMALGISGELADKILFVRRGFDKMDCTVDDHVFQETFDVASEIINFIELEVDEIGQINNLNSEGKIKTDSLFYLMQSKGKLNGKGHTLTITCVYNTEENRIEYWREK